MSDRNAEIWSTRLQREILALESSDDDSKKIELLPPFITTIGHSLNIEGGIAKVEFRIDVEVGVGVKNENVVYAHGSDAGVKKSGGDGGKTADEGDKVEGENAEKGDDNKEKSDYGEVPEDREADASVVEGDTESENPAKEESETSSEKKTSDEAVVEKVEVEKAEVEGETKDATKPIVVIVLDASLYWKPDACADQNTPSCYPFQKPLAIIKSGSELFSGGSTIKDGDEVDIDLDWTPSIHLSDAVTNVALKIRECVKRGEPLHASTRNEDSGNEGFLSEALKREARESLMETKKAMGAMFSSFAARGSTFAAKGQSMSKAFGESLTALAESGAVAKAASTDGDENAAANQKKETKVCRRAIPNAGEEIDLSEDPWNQCVGMYSCKAIRRPEFVEVIIMETSEKQKKEKEVATSGFAGASSMFSRFAQTAKSVMEESFLMITQESIIEFKSNKLNIGSGTVTFAINIDQMAKLKFRREESLSLFFKQATDDPLVYMCLDSALAVQDIQNVLKKHGVKGKHTNAATQRVVQMALNMVALIQQKEKELLDNPSVNQVNDIMDLYRQAAEKFETAGDPRHAEVMAHMKRFLNQKFTTSILDGSFVKSSGPSFKTSSLGESMASPTQASSVPQGEILEQPSYNHLDNDDDDDDDDNDDNDGAIGDVSEGNALNSSPKSPEKSKKEEDKTLQNMDDIFEEAKRDMENLGMGDDDIKDILNSPPQKSSNTDGNDDDAFAELDAMLNDADKELNELLNS